MAALKSALMGDSESMLLVGAATTVVVLPLVVFILWSILGASSKRTPEGPPPVWGGGWPLIGHFLKFSGNPVATIREGYEKMGNVFTMRFLGFNLTFLLGPDASAPFFDASDEQLSQSEPYKFMTPIFGKGIVFDAPLDKKNEQLRFITKSLNSRALETHVSAIAQETEAFLDSWGDQGTVDLLDQMAKLTILTASRCLLGKEVREHLFGEVADLLHTIDEGISPIAIFFPNLPLPAFKRRDAARARFAAIFAKVIADRRRAMAAGAPRPEDLLQGFMEAEYSTGERLSDDAITGMLLGTLFAGQHTSSISSTWTILHLVAHQAEAGTYDRAMREQLEALGPDNYAAALRRTTPPAAGGAAGAGAPVAGITYDAVSSRMNFLHNAMKEALRMAPPLIMLMRKVYSPLRVGEKSGCPVVVPRGHLVFVSPAVSMNLPTGADNPFTRPEAFDPDRYDPPRKEDEKTRHSYSAFGGGRHACLGERFGYLQVKTIVSIVLRRFEIRMADPLPSPNYRAMVVGPTQPCRITYRKRATPYVPPALPAAAAGGAAASK